MTDQANNKLVKEVIATELRWTEAHREMDLDTIAAILSDDYRQIGADGSLISRTQLLESYHGGGRHCEIAESSEHDVQILGEVAILIGRWRGKGINSGEKFDYSARFLSVYVLVEGEWKLHLDTSIPLQD
jgi:ketosteroid isomerase-like protein